MSRTKYRDLPPESKARRQISLKKYHKSPKGFLSRLYKNMRGRIEGIQVKKAHLYEGLSLFPRQEFYLWALGSLDFNRLYAAWVISGYDRRLTPTVDRIDSTIGYTKENVRWMTHSENSRLGSLNRWRSS